MFWLVIFFFMARMAKADTVQQVVKIIDSAPTSVSVMSQESMVHLTAQTTHRLYFSGSATDPNTCKDLTLPAKWAIKVYRSQVVNGFNCTPDHNDCYVADTAQLTFTQCDKPGDITLNYQGYVDLYYNTTATDVGSDYPDDTWTIQTQFTDPSTQTQLNATDQFEVASLIAVAMTPSINFGHVQIGVDSAVQTVVYTSAGNRPVDIHQKSVNDLLCDGAESDNIPAQQVKYHLTGKNFLWDDITAKTVSDNDNIAYNLPYQQLDDTLSSTEIYYRLRVPSGKYSGVCTNELSILAVSAVH